MNRHTCGILTVSDRAASGLRADASGPAIERGLINEPIDIVARRTVPDDITLISASIKEFADYCDIILTTGGTGFAERDLTPEATRIVIDRDAPGISELLRWSGFQHNPRAALSRGVSGIIGRTLVINLPGSPKACLESIEALKPILSHALQILHDEFVDH